MFNTGWKTRGVRRFLLFFFLIFSSSAFAVDYPVLKVYRIDKDEDISNSLLGTGERGCRLEPFEQKLILLKFVVTFKNQSGSDYEGKFQTAWNSVRPNSISYIEGWEDTTVIVPPGGKTLEQVVTIHPTIGSTKSEFQIAAILRDNGDFKATAYKVVTQVRPLDTATYDMPMILPDTASFSFDRHVLKYSPGTVNTVRWKPGIQTTMVSSLIQSAYVFDVDDPTRLYQCTRGLLKTLGAQGEREDFFQGLEDGHTYGYLVKGEYTTQERTLTLYSDIVYSIQDNTPPEPVTEIHADIDGDGRAVVWWKKVDDALSGVSEYRVYRAVDTGEEIFFNALPANAAMGDSFVTFDGTLDSNYTYYYTVHAVDRVGNEGYGNPSEAVSLGEGVRTNPTPFEPPATGSPTDPDPWIIRGVIHSQSIDLNGLEKRIRFQAVRDDTTFFDHPPEIGSRFFDSGWIHPDSIPADPIDVNRRFWTFDYSYTGEVANRIDGSIVYIPGGEFIDSNFVNGHHYYTRVVREYITTLDTVRLQDVIPDCFPPADIRNLKVQSFISDSAYTEWSIRLQWDPAEDDVSGLKRYRIYRKAVGLDTAFSEITDESIILTSPAYVDTQLHPYRDHPLLPNPVILYRVVSEDLIGNERDADDTNWESGSVALWPPRIVFTDTEQVIPVGEDTLYTKNDEAKFRLTGFDFSNVEEIIVGVNGDEYTIALDENNGFVLPIGTDGNGYSIRVRVLYRGGRSSIWSDEKMVVRESDEPPFNLHAFEDSSYTGNILLEWSRPSLDAVAYEIWRREGSKDSTWIGTIASREAVVYWTDEYGLDETTGIPGDTLVAYQHYSYCVRKKNIFDNLTPFSISDGAYCNRPPLVVEHEIKTSEGKDIITIRWKRVSPTVAAGWWQTRIRVAEDSLTNVIFETEPENDVVDDTTFTLMDDLSGEYPVEVEPGHNYIFELRETPQSPEGAVSGWSIPYTVSLVSLDSLFVQPQPRGDIFISWEEDILVDYLPVSSYEICRSTLSDTVCWRVSESVTSVVDEGNNLTQGSQYFYRVTALNALDQVLATNTKEAVCDKGAAFIPDATTSDVRYFNSDSITVCWTWRDEAGNPLEGTTEGARLLRIETSASNAFPTDPILTLSTGWFSAHPDERCKRVPVPETVNSENERVYYRMSARDRWGQPFVYVWSSEFYGIREVVFDPLPPYAVKDLQIQSTEALYHAVDTVIVSLGWTEKGVKYPADENTYWSELIGNIARYRLELEIEGVTYGRNIVLTGADSFTGNPQRPADSWDRFPESIGKLLLAPAGFRAPPMYFLGVQRGPTVLGRQFEMVFPEPTRIEAGEPVRITDITRTRRGTRRCGRRLVHPQARPTTRLDQLDMRGRRIAVVDAIAMDAVCFREHHLNSLKDTEAAGSYDDAAVSVYIDTLNMMGQLGVHGRRVGQFQHLG